MEERFISIFNPRIARGLIKKGFLVVDIKPFKENSDRTIFIFEKNEELIKEMYSH